MTTTLAPTLHPDQLLSHRVLQTEARYRVVHAGSDLVLLAVVSAPGLAAGTQVRCTRAAVLKMRVVDEKR